MKFRFWALVFVLLLMSSCRKELGIETRQEVSSQGQRQEVESYPSAVELPKTSELEEYPLPPPTLIPLNVYPGPGERTEIESETKVLSPNEIIWGQAEEMILSGEVAQIFQYHSLFVEIILQDGRELSTFQPELDEVFKVVERCGEICENTIISTE